MNNKKILITGITGFLGGHLASYLIQQYSTCHLIGIGRNTPLYPVPYAFHRADLSDQASVECVIAETQPDIIFHLAGTVFSYNWHELYVGNVLATLHLFEAIKRTQIKTHVVITGSAAEYGVVPAQCLPILETYPSVPKSPYGMTKLWQTLLAQSVDPTEVQVTTARIFNVIGSGAPRQLSTGDIFYQLQQIKQKQQAAQLVVGNLQLKRDFLDVDDVCSALVALALKGCAGQIYNICSGVSTALHDVLTLAIELSGLELEIVFDQNKAQNSYVQDIYGSNEKLKREMGWCPLISLSQSIHNAFNGVSK